MSSILLLIIAFGVYSTTGVFSKFSSAEDFLSFRYLGYFALVMIAMGIYAILWQILLKRVPLTQAFLFKSMTVLFSLCFACVIFRENITPNNTLGAALIIAGIIVNAQCKVEA